MNGNLRKIIEDQFRKAVEDLYNNPNPFATRTTTLDSTLWGAIGRLQPNGLEFYSDRFCYKTKTVVRGIADQRRPNNKKHLYRKVTIQIPLAYRIGNKIVCHPSLLPRFQKAVDEFNMIRKENHE